jgi:hypothetical protein
MNLISLMIAVSMMSIGTLVSAYFLIEPPLALSRLSGQADADAVVESLRLTALRGKKVTAEPSSGPPFTSVTLLKADDLTMTLVDTTTGRCHGGDSACECTITKPFTDVVSITCKGSGFATDSRGGRFRSSQTVLIGGYPCESDLFPEPLFPKCSVMGLE